MTERHDTKTPNRVDWLRRRRLLPCRAFRVACPDFERWRSEIAEWIRHIRWWSLGPYPPGRCTFHRPCMSPCSPVNLPLATCSGNRPQSCPNRLVCPLHNNANRRIYTMALITTSIKWNKSLLTSNVWLHYFDCCSTFVQCLLVCVCVCVCVFACVLVCFSLCVIIVFFSDCRIYLFSSLAARVFNKLTRYSFVTRYTMTF